MTPAAEAVRTTRRAARVGRLAPGVGRARASKGEQRRAKASKGEQRRAKASKGEQRRAKASKGEGAAILAARQPRANRGRAAIQPRPSLDRAEPNRNKLVRTAPNRDRSVLALRSNRA
ncbi:protamine P1 [Burkholderia pseudomallei]|nr:protamine P1 [Burkholderia pseudomallei]ARL52983.1 protamine P1 [Burkholderia pseudomallei]NRD82018.1 protamine P1 [Burkholderia pseudomallei]